VFFKAIINVILEFNNTIRFTNDNNILSLNILRKNFILNIILLNIRFDKLI